MDNQNAQNQLTPEQYFTGLLSETNGLETKMLEIQRAIDQSPIQTNNSCTAIAMQRGLEAVMWFQRSLMEYKMQEISARNQQQAQQQPAQQQQQPVQTPPDYNGMPPGTLPNGKLPN